MILDIDLFSYWSLKSDQENSEILLEIKPLE